MNPQIANTIDLLQLPKPKPSFFPHKTLFTHSLPRPTLSQRLRFSLNKPRNCTTQWKLRITASTSLSSTIVPKEEQEEDAESAQLFEKLKEAERKRINELEELDNKANLQLERQLVMASSWSRALLTLRGKLKGTEWDPENSHRIDFSHFLRLLDSNNVQFLEYSNYGQTISGGDFSFPELYITFDMKLVGIWRFHELYFDSC